MNSDKEMDSKESKQIWTTAFRVKLFSDQNRVKTTENLFNFFIFFLFVYFALHSSPMGAVRSSGADSETYTSHCSNWLNLYCCRKQRFILLTLHFATEYTLIH